MGISISSSTRADNIQRERRQEKMKAQSTLDTATSDRQGIWSAKTSPSHSNLQKSPLESSQTPRQVQVSQKKQSKLGSRPKQKQIDTHRQEQNSSQFGLKSIKDMSFNTNSPNPIQQGQENDIRPSVYYTGGGILREEREEKLILGQQEYTNSWKTARFGQVRSSKPKMSQIDENIEDEFSQFQWIVAQDEEPQVKKKIEIWNKSKILRFANRFKLKAIANKQIDEIQPERNGRR